MRIPPALAADLALLTDAFDVGAVDIAEAFSLLDSDVAAAITSYAGLTVRVVSAGSHAELTTLDDPDLIARLVTSLRIPVPATTSTPGPSVVIVLYATVSGAFIDLAADLAWLTDVALADVGLDADLGAALHAHPTSSLRALSSIDQALGALVGQGRTPEEALVVLEALAAEAGSDRHTAAAAILDALPSTGVVHDSD